MIPDAEMWDNTSLTSRGLNCLGPRSLDSMFVKEECSRKAKIDFDTALILVENRRDGLRLSPRCVECQTEHRMSQLLSVRDLLLEDGEELATCVFKGCDREPMYRLLRIMLSNLQGCRTTTARTATAVCDGRMRRPYGHGRTVTDV
jgi:hypothetical protein